MKTELLSTETVASHTPGPWKADEGHTNDPSICGAWGCIRGSKDYILADVYADTEELGREALSNARLMSAAPDLLALAKQYASECSQCNGKGKVALWLSLSEVDCEECSDIRAVIAKAEGK